MAIGQSQNDEAARRRKRTQYYMERLARHKEPKLAWYTCVGPEVEWGTQQMMWPVSPYALKAEASPRVSVLATPKRNFQAETGHEERPLYYHSVGRSSTIWTLSEGARKAIASDRLKMLAHPKKRKKNMDKSQFYFSCGRESPIWKIGRGATQFEERPRTTALAVSKGYHPNFVGERPIQSVVRSGALNANPSPRISDLATPRGRPGGPFRDAKWPISEEARSCVASARCIELARAKPLAEGFQLAREIEWPVSKAAKRAHASARIIELAHPVIH